MDIACYIHCSDEPRLTVDAHRSDLFREATLLREQSDFPGGSLWVVMNAPTQPGGIQRLLLIPIDLDR